MNLHDGLLGAMGACLIVYTMTGGADFGGGVWDLLASGPRKREQRALVAETIAPIWEANHIWMIVLIVVLFSGFPDAFATVSIALHIPISLALIGIVLRGAAFTFRAYGLEGASARGPWGRVFAWSSLMTPTFLGMVLAGMASGEIAVEDGHVTSGYFAGWLSPFALSVGAFALGLFALLAATYLALEAETRAPSLVEDFRARAIASEIACGLFGALAALRASVDAPELFQNLLGSPWSVGMQLATAATASLALWSLARRRYRAARYAVVLQVTFVVVGFGLAMDGHILLPALPAERAGLLDETARPILIALVAAAAIVAPALLFLYRVFRRPPVRSGEPRRPG